MQVDPQVLLGATTGLLASFLYAISVVVYRSQRDEIRPLQISAIKMWVAFCFMFIVVLLPFREAPFYIPLFSAFFLLASVTLGPIIGDTLYLTSQERIGVAYAFPIVGTYPIITYFLAVLFLGDTLSAIRFAGTVLAVIGVIIIAGEQSSNSIASTSNFDKVGIGLALSTAFLYAIGTSFLQVGLVGVDPIDGNFLRTLVGSVEFLPLFMLIQIKGAKRPSKRVTKIVAFAGLLGMGFGSLLYVSTVKFVGAAMTSVLGSMSPLFAVPISVFFLKEKLSRKAAIGILAAVLGVILVVLGF
jgi:drug/metabolite transporter (DMT)-like permease